MSASFEQIDPYRWRIPQHRGVRVPGLVFSSAQMLESIQDEG
ncbi:MAG: hypothetical protein AAGA54_22670 [Myxococcota bacterium]